MNPSHFMIVLALAMAACDTSEASVTKARTSTGSAAPKKAEVLAEVLVPRGNKLAFELTGVGAQIYACRPKKDDATRFEWVLTAPVARLMDTEGNVVGHHYGGPTWESIDGTKVIGKLEQKIAAPASTDIPWLLLSAKSNEGQGKFGNVTYVQRFNTHGGMPPTSDCDAAHAGKEVRVDYTASYYFYVAGG